MRKSRFSEQQIAFILRQAEEGTTVEEVCLKAGISVQTYYRWRSKYGGLMPSEMKRLKQLEEENGRLRKLVADLSLDKEMLQDVIKRKLVRGSARTSGAQPLTLIESVSLSMRFGRPGRCRSGARAACSGSTPRPTTTKPAAPIRPPLGNGSGRSPRRASGTAIDGSTSCFVARAGTSTTSGPTGSIGTKVFNYVGKFRAGG